MRDKSEIERKMFGHTMGKFQQARQEQEDWERLMQLAREIETYAKSQLDIAKHDAKVLAFFLSEHGQDIIPVVESITRRNEEAKNQLPPIKDLAEILMRESVPKKRVTGDALLTVIAKGMVDQKAPMTVSEMLEYLQENGFDLPGANARNNLISMLSRSEDRFTRVGRGTYYPTPKEEARIREMQGGP